MFTSADYADYNTLSTEENDGYFADDIYTSFSPVNTCIPIWSAFVHYSPIGLGNGLMPNRGQALI